MLDIRVAIPKDQRSDYLMHAGKSGAAVGAGTGPIVWVGSANDTWAGWSTNYGVWSRASPATAGSRISFPTLHACPQSPWPSATWSPTAARRPITSIAASPPIDGSAILHFAGARPTQGVIFYTHLPSWRAPRAREGLR